MSYRGNALVHPIPKGSKECMTVEEFMQERRRKQHLERLKAIQERENVIPGPCEAKKIMKLIEKERLHATERRLAEEEREAKITARLNNMMMNRIAHALEVGKVDDHLSDRSMREWYGDWLTRSVDALKHQRLYCRQRCKMRRKVREERLREDRLNFRLMRNIQKRAQAPVSRYGREVMQSNWPKLLKTVYKDARFPCSDWWDEYLHCVAGKRQRKPPPHPPTCSCSYLEDFEERQKRRLLEMYEQKTKPRECKRHQHVLADN